MDIFLRGKKYRKFTTRQKLRFFALFFCVFLFVFTSSACITGDGDPLSYKNDGFSARVSSYGLDRDFEALFTFSPPSENGDRDFSADFLAPETLCGLRLKKEGDRLSLSLGDTEYVSLGYSEYSHLEFFGIVKILAPDSAIRSISSVSGNECGLQHIDRLTAVTLPSAVLYIDPDSGIPLKISLSDSGAFLTVSDFKSNSTAQ